MRIIYLSITIMFFCSAAYAQTIPIKADSTTEAFKTYLEKNIRFPAVSRENYVQGKMVIGFTLNDAQKISNVYFVKHLDSDCDSAVVAAVRAYTKQIKLPAASYAIGLQFMILEHGETDDKIVPFNTNLYKNFLFELHIKGYIVAKKATIVY